MLSDFFRLYTMRSMKFNKRKLYKARERKCLMCTKTFESEWAGNRICKKCRTSSSWKEGNMTSVDPVCTESAALS